MITLEGRRIALLATRQRDELAAIVHRSGGQPISAPASEQIVCHDDFAAFYDGLTEGRFSIAILQNGAGITALIDEARRRGRFGEVLRGLRQVRIVCRGGKPLAVLRRLGLSAHMTTGRPHTTGELLHTLLALDVADRGIVLVHCGERNYTVSRELRLRGARVREVCPYEWALPDDLEPLRSIVRDVLARRLDAVLFTSQIQCRHLFQVAAEMGCAERLASGLSRHLVVGAVGQVCARSLSRAGVTAHVMPASPNMQSLITDLAHHFEQRGMAHSTTSR